MGSVTGSVVGCLALVVALLLIHRRKGRNNEKGDRNAISEGRNNEKEDFVQEATNNFNEDLLISAGGFGKVYRGVLKDETKVAVQRGSCQSQQGLAEFGTEIEMLLQFRHRHLVTLIGYCNEQNERIIIYKYMEKGSVKNYLLGSSDAAYAPPCLSWRQRLEICMGAARGLHYLHSGSAKAIIHHDVKSANILLLDENLMTKVADFGLSKTGPEIDKTHVSTAVKGSFGYGDPEYLVMQQLTEKSDVYSFRVVMFEGLCGRPVIDLSLPKKKVNLVEWIMKLWQEERSTNTINEEIVDPCLGRIKPESLHLFVEIAKKSLAKHGISRSCCSSCDGLLLSIVSLLRYCNIIFHEMQHGNCS